MPSAIRTALSQAAVSASLARSILASRRYAESRASTAYRLTLAAGIRRAAQRHRWIAQRVANGTEPDAAERQSWHAIPGSRPHLEAVLFLARGCGQ